MKTCVSCKHWDPYYGQASEKRRLDVARRKVWTTGDCINPKFPGRVAFEPPADFGCTLHDEIDENT